MKYHGLTIEQELEMDQKFFGVAYYRIVNGVKERIDPTSLVILKPNPIIFNEVEIEYDRGDTKLNIKSIRVT